jgi:hypothetical protein
MPSNCPLVRLAAAADDFYSINPDNDDDDNTATATATYALDSAALYIIAESDHVGPLITLPPQRGVCAKSPSYPPSPSPSPGALPSPHHRSQASRSLMAALAYAQAASPADDMELPDLTNSKSSKSSSFHSSAHSDYMGPSDLSHFEDINLDDPSAGPSTFPTTANPSSRIVFENRSLSSASLTTSTRSLTGPVKPRYPNSNAKGPAVHAVQRQHSQLTAPSKQTRRGFTSPSAPSLTTTNLAAPHRSSRSPSPSNSHTSARPTLSRKSSHTLEVSPSTAVNRRQSWQDAKRKTVKEREAECDDEDDELPEDAVIWNIPISPRPAHDRSPAPSTCGSPPQPSPSLSTASATRPSSTRTSPGPPMSRLPSPSHDPASVGESPPSLARQRTQTWEDTYGNLDPDAKKITEALEEFQVEVERKQDVERQKPSLTRSTSLNRPEPKTKKPALPPVRKSDPLIDPFQPSAEKQKYLSRTRPSWLPPKNPKEEKKHLKEYQRMLARIEEAGKLLQFPLCYEFKLTCPERLEAQRVQEEALAREKASRIKAEYWSNLLLPNWNSEMLDPQLRATHRKMWWNGIPPNLRGQVWHKAVGNDLEVTEGTFKVALEKAQAEIKRLGDEALGGQYPQIVENTRAVFPDLKMFAAPSTTAQEQPLHQDLVNVCLAYSKYRPDVSHSNSIHHVAALLLLSLPAPHTFIVLSNLLNRSLPLSFLVQDSNAMHAAYLTTLRALAKKVPDLAQRLETLRVEPRDYLFPMFSSLFCGRLGVESAARIMDVYALEGDKIPPRAAVAVLGILESSCTEGDAEIISKTLAEKPIDMDVDEFMARVYEAGKSS